MFGNKNSICGGGSEVENLMRPKIATFSPFPVRSITFFAAQGSQIMKGGVAMKIRQYLPTGGVGHIQIAGMQTPWTSAKLPTPTRRWAKASAELAFRAGIPIRRRWAFGAVTDAFAASLADAVNNWG